MRALFLTSIAVVISPALAWAQSGVNESLRLPQPVTRTVPGGVLHPSLQGAIGTQDIIVQLTHEALARYAHHEWDARESEIEAQQEAFIERAAVLPSFRVIAKVEKVLNAVFVEVDSAALELLATDPNVRRIAPVSNYQLQLSEVKPYVESQMLQDAGADGSGVSIAIFDSGIDYTHANFGGPGTLMAYDAAYASADSRDGLFPTSKVVEGWDFVGEVWPDGPLMEDPDPIDFEGHGTHVADIAGGLGGMAPGADLYAVKVCSAISSACSGIALIRGMEYAVDPNGDGDTSDHVDVINMSLGANYGTPFDDDLSQAIDAATQLGVFTVAAAGNGSDKPFVTGTPAAASTAMSVAQTAVPSAVLDVMEIVAPAADAGLYDAVFQPWSTPLITPVSGGVTYGDGSGGNLDGCAPFTGSLSGIVVVDRGGCFFSDKIRNIELAGGTLGIIAQNTGDPPFPGSFGGGAPIGIPGFMIGLFEGLLIKQPGAQVSFDPANGIDLVGSVVVSSSRGPAMDNSLKPEIGAPGASVSAEVGTGSGETPFGGTSGASPVVAGIAAQLIQKRGGELQVLMPGAAGLPQALKSVLVVSADRNVLTNVDTSGGSLAEVTRIGGGEVRAHRANWTPVIAYEESTGNPTLSFGLLNVSGKTTVRKRLILKNPTHLRVNYQIEPEFRFADDQMSGAVEIRAPRYVSIGPKGTRSINVRIIVDGDKLPDNSLSSGLGGNVGANLTATEYDGYLVFKGTREFAVPWHVLPMKSARVLGRDEFNPKLAQPSKIRLNNRGVGTAQLQDFSLLGTSPNIPSGPAGGQAPTPDIRAVGYRTINPGCGAGFGLAFIVNTWERQSHLIPVSHNINIDTTGDEIPDYIVLNRDLSFDNITDGQQVSWVFDVDTGSVGAFFFAEHATNTGNTVLVICGEQIGLTSADLATTRLSISVDATDFYFGGPGDSVGPFTIVPGGDQYVMSDGAGGPAGDIPGRSTARAFIESFPLLPGTTPELGILLQTNSDRGPGAHGAATLATEAKLVYAGIADTEGEEDPGDEAEDVEEVGEE